MIPDFDHNNVLPPHIGDPAVPGNLSPYICSSLQLAIRFATSHVRIQLLKNLLNFRTNLRQAGLGDNCFQWIDGSFVENKEALLGEAPGDIDVLTFYHGYLAQDLESIKLNFPAFNNRRVAKEDYSLDHIPLNIGSNCMFTYSAVQYYSMLFNHSRYGVWKGILLIELNTPLDDDAALQYLNDLEHAR